MTRPGLLIVYKKKPQRVKALVCERFCVIRPLGGLSQLVSVRKKRD
jgi:hypothetical protein